MNDALKPATGGWQTKQRLTLLPVLAGTTGGWQTKQRLTLLPVLVSETTTNKDIKYCQDGEQDLPRIVDAISEKDIDIVEAHKKIDYDQLSDAESKKRFYMGVLRKAVNNAVELDSERDVDILIDSPPLRVNPELTEFGRELSSDHRIRWFETKRSASDRYLIVHDYETGVVSDHIEGIPGKDNLYKRLRRRVRNVSRRRRETYGLRRRGIVHVPSFDTGLAVWPRCGACHFFA